MSDIEEEERVWVSESLWRHEPVGAGCFQPGLLLPFRAKLSLLRLNARTPVLADGSDRLPTSAEMFQHSRNNRMQTGQKA